MRGTCHDRNVPASLPSGRKDDANGGQWYVDQQTNTFWTWDTPESIAQKFTDIVVPLQLGGIMAWSFGEDSFDYAHIKALQNGYKGKGPTKRMNAEAESWPATLRYVGPIAKTSSRYPTWFFRLGLILGMDEVKIAFIFHC